MFLYEVMWSLSTWPHRKNSHCYSCTNTKWNSSLNTEFITRSTSAWSSILQ